MSRRELKAVVHHLRVYLEHQKGIGALGSVPATAEAREQFEALVAMRRKQEIKRLQASLHGDSAPAPQGRPAPQTASARPEPQQQQPPQREPMPRPSFMDQGSSKKKKDVPPPEINSGGSPLWKQLGARPESIFKKSASKPEQPAAKRSAPVDPREQERPPRSQPEPARHAGPAFKEVRRQDSRPPSKRPQPKPRGNSLFGEEWDRQNRPSSPPVKGFDSSPEQVRRLETMTNMEKLSFLRECMGDCTRCKLSQERTNIVFGDGDPNAEIVFVGEGPGFHEDKQGIPFVGKAGQLLNKMIFAMGIEREDVYIANVVKCRPPGNRDPAPDEIRMCSPFLYKQLETLQPRVIITLGRFASQCLLDTKRSMGSMRGRWQDWRGVEVMPTYHPAYLLRNPESKREAWKDLQMVMEKLDLKGR